MKSIFGKLGNSIEIGKINLKCICAKCDKEINPQIYHLVINLNFKYYGRMARDFSEKRKKTALGTSRLHFGCFDKMSNEMIELNNNLEKLEIDLFAKEM